MFCKNCGKEIDEDARFCPECGERQNKEEEIQASYLLGNLYYYGHGIPQDIDRVVFRRYNKGVH